MQIHPRTHTHTGAAGELMPREFPAAAAAPVTRSPRARGAGNLVMLVMLVIIQHYEQCLRARSRW